MTAVKLEPDVKILVYPYDAITKQSGSGLGVSDVLASNINALAGGGGTGNYDTEFGSGEPWYSQVGYSSLPKNVSLIRFGEDGKVYKGASAFQGVSSQVTKELAGFVITHNNRRTNCVIDGVIDVNNPVPDNGYRSLSWKPLQGDNWQTYVPNLQPYRNFIRHTTQQPTKTIRIRTKEKLAAQQGFSADIIWRGVAAGMTNKAGFRISWCDGLYSIVWRQGAGIELQKKVSGKDVTWQQLVEDSGDFTGRTTLGILAIGGRIVVQLNDELWWKVEMKGGQPVDFRMPAGNIEVSSFGIDALVGIALPDCLNLAGTKVQTATITRKVPANFDRSIYATGYVKGWQGKRTKMSVTGNIDYQELQYTVNLTADTYESPMASAIMIDFPPSYIKVDQSPIDLAPAAMQAGYSGMQPGVMDTAAITAELFRSTLDDLYPTWKTLVKPFAPISVDVKWRYKDDVTGAITVDADYIRLFEGYIDAPDFSSDEVLKQHLSIKATDTTTRLKKPAGFIDGTFLPFDFKLLSSGKSALYGCECVQFLLERVLGSTVAGQLNGNGDPFRFQKSPYPLLGNSALAGYLYTIAPPASSGFYLPAPFGSNVMDWINTIAGYDRSVFFWGTNPDDPAGRPVPTYGRIEQIMYQGYNTPLAISDTNGGIYVNDFFDSVTRQTRSEKLYNDFVVWGANAKELEGILPSYFSGRATLPESRDSWKRTLLTQLDYISQVADGQQLAQAIANGIANQFNGSPMQEATFSLPKGEAILRWGMKIQPQMSGQFSDTGMELNGVNLRIERVDHQFNFMRDSPSIMKTSLTCRTLSNTGY